MDYAWPPVGQSAQSSCHLLITQSCPHLHLSKSTSWAPPDTRPRTPPLPAFSKPRLPPLPHRPNFSGSFPSQAIALTSPVHVTFPALSHFLHSHVSQAENFISPSKLSLLSISSLSAHYLGFASRRFADTAVQVSPLMGEGWGLAWGRKAATACPFWTGLRTALHMGVDRQTGRRRMGPRSRKPLEQEARSLSL